MAKLGKVQVHVPHTQGPTTEENCLQFTESFKPEYNTESVSFYRAGSHHSNGTHFVRVPVAQGGILVACCSCHLLSIVLGLRERCESRGKSFGQWLSSQRRRDCHQPDMAIRDLYDALLFRCQRCLVSKEPDALALMVCYPNRFRAS